MTPEDRQLLLQIAAVLGIYLGSLAAFCLVILLIVRVFGVDS
jgi:hypothetical protein